VSVIVIEEESSNISLVIFISFSVVIKTLNRVYPDLGG